MNPERLEELRAVGNDAGADLVESREGQAAGIVCRLQHERGHGADQHSFRHASGAMPADLARDFATARGMTHHCRVFQVERLDQRGQVVGIGIHFIAGPRRPKRLRSAAIRARTQLGVRRPVFVVSLRTVFRLDAIRRFSPYFLKHPRLWVDS